ncbi:MAG: tRNA (adenosine(37)-N6)-threonylcarbamoyltransferase complex transferase subunit TsaD [Myxococcota bacterium]|nr:tRNA (adenosine(37)-N6)-threonylcarbamoyltransferase complex transferase subunit TsaD [Myxococcota bacterium]
MIIMGIETSCDETAVSIIGSDGIAADLIWTQSVHQAFGGVVPELASRAHIEKVVACTQKALQEAGLERPDGVAATAGPGLIGAVLVGFCFGKSLSIGWGVPFVGVNHLEGHLLSPLLDSPRPEFPFLSLVVSGGHTTLYLAEGVGSYRVLGQTVDDAAGEAYDKVARMMGLGYPGGPLIDALAQDGDPQAISFPRPRPPKPGRARIFERYPLDMSFSGLKTAVRNYLQKTQGWNPSDVAASFQAAVVDVLMDRVHKAVRETGVQSVAIGGGVAANSGLRRALQDSPYTVFIPPKRRCTDNAAMIANVGRLRMLNGQRDSLDMAVRANWPVGV